MLSESESGVVTQVMADKAIVKLVRSESCDKCAARIICRLGDGDSREMLAFNPVQAAVGDHVEISETGNLLLILSLLQFGVPLSGLILGVFTVYWLQPGSSFLSKEVLMSMGGLIGLILGGAAVWRFLKSWAKHLSCVFEIVRVINQPNRNPR